jgi:phage-related protein
MPDRTSLSQARPRKALVFLAGRIESPPFSVEAQDEAGLLLARLQRGATLSLPHSRPLPSLCRHCHELRVRDRDVTWRVIYRIDPEEIVVADVFAKKSGRIPHHTLKACSHRLAQHDRGRTR